MRAMFTIAMTMLVTATACGKTTSNQLANSATEATVGLGSAAPSSSPPTVALRPGESLTLEGDVVITPANPILWRPAPDEQVALAFVFRDGTAQLVAVRRGTRAVLDRIELHLAYGSQFSLVAGNTDEAVMVAESHGGSDDPGSTTAWRLRWDPDTGTAVVAEQRSWSEDEPNIPSWAQPTRAVDDARMAANVLSDAECKKLVVRLARCGSDPRAADREATRLWLIVGIFNGFDDPTFQQNLDTELARWARDPAAVCEAWKGESYSQLNGVSGVRAALDANCTTLREAVASAGGPPVLLGH
jgi:hypothetical protein